MSKAHGHYVVSDVRRALDPKDDQEQVIGSTVDVERAVRLAKRASGEGRINLQHSDGSITEFTAHGYTEHDLSEAQKQATAAGRPPPTKLDPYHGALEHAANMPAARVPGSRVSAPKPQPRRSAGRRKT